MEEKDEMQRVAEGYEGWWLGGRREGDGDWHWLDGETWGYEQLYPNFAQYFDRMS